MVKYKNIFGPVPSRRLGASLGIDLVPAKTCTMNCIYCEVGRTNKLTVQRDEYVNYDEIMLELNNYLTTLPNLDFITFSGAGEPTLNSRIGEIIEFLKSNYPQYKLALLTNGSLFTSEEIRKECSKVDVILPSLDAVSQDVFIKINRPHPKLDNEKIINGLISLRSEFNKQIWLEIFIVPGINDSEDELSLLKNNIAKIHPDKIQINSLDRPGTEEWIEPLTEEKRKIVLSRLAPLKVEFIGSYKSDTNIEKIDNSVQELVFSTLKRRPCTIHDLVKITGFKINELNKYLIMFLSSGEIKVDHKNRRSFFKLSSKNYN